MAETSDLSKRESNYSFFLFFMSACSTFQGPGSQPKPIMVQTLFFYIYLFIYLYIYIFFYGGGIYAWLVLPPASISINF